MPRSTHPPSRTFRYDGLGTVFDGKYEIGHASYWIAVTHKQTVYTRIGDSGYTLHHSVSCELERLVTPVLLHDFHPYLLRLADGREVEVEKQKERYVITNHSALMQA